MATKENQITCPSCATPIDVNDVLKHQLEEKIRNEYLQEKNTLLKTQQEKEAQLAKERNAFEKLKKQQETEIAQRVEKANKEAEKQIADKLDKENEARFKTMQAELAEKSDKVKDLLKKEAEIEQLKREKEEATDIAKLEAQKELTQQLATEKKKIKQLVSEESEFKLKGLQKQLEDQKRLTAEMKRKQEQGSMQLQGEVMELAIEEWLTQQFPLDSIAEIKKGANGADCLQTVNTREFSNCGTIYYESKRTKQFSPSWIAKFKNDKRDKDATIGVLVTQTMPKGMDRMGIKDGIWICTYNEFKGLCAVLRQSIIKWNAVKQQQENKGGKMELLYDFLTSDTFRLQVEGIVDGFTQMQNDLTKEKNALARIWKQREKQIQVVTQNTIAMYGSVKGIAGNAIQSIPPLELGDGDTDEVA